MKNQIHRTKLSKIQKYLYRTVVCGKNYCSNKIIIYLAEDRKHIYYKNSIQYSLNKSERWKLTNWNSKPLIGKIYTKCRNEYYNVGNSENPSGLWQRSCFDNIYYRKEWYPNYDGWKQRMSGKSKSGLSTGSHCLRMTNKHRATQKKLRNSNKKQYVNMCVKDFSIV